MDYPNFLPNEGPAFAPLLDARVDGRPTDVATDHLGNYLACIGRLARRSGALFNPGRAVRQPDRHRACGYLEALIRDGAPAAIIQTSNDLMSAWILKHPEHRSWSIRLS